jgi:hypothetical protein
MCCACLLASTPAWAQNSAEKQPPAKPKQAPAQNSAEKPAKKRQGSKDEAPPEPPQDDATATEGEATAPEAEPAPEQPAAPSVPAPASTAAPAAASTAGNAAESAPPINEPDATGAATSSGDAAGPVNPNAAETRPAGAAAGNAAEAGHGSDDAGIAEPPEPPFTLPTPDETAGRSQGYKPPEIKLTIPGMDDMPEQLPDSAFNTPNRDYLKDRPLPGLDVDETEQERVARNIEESLKQIDLSVESRPDGAIQIPLPSGTVTFKAAQAFQFDRRNRILTFTGNAEIVFGDVAVWADSIEVNDSAATAYAKGYVALQQRDEIVYADEAYINYDTKNLELFFVEGNTSGPRINGRLYYTADRATGTLDSLVMEKAEITTCDPFCGSVDEFHLSAHKVVYKRNTSVVLHDVYMYIRSHKVGYIPLLAFPLPRQQRYSQQESDVKQSYGYNSQDGLFAKFAYTYSTRWVENVQTPLLGVVKLDTMQNRGASFGLRQDFYTSAFGVTTIKTRYQQDWPEAVATGLFGRKAANAGKEFEFTLDQELNLSRYLNGSLKINRVNKFNPSSTVTGAGTRTNTWSNSFSLNYQKNKTQAALTASQTINISGGYKREDGTLEPTLETNTSSATGTITRDMGNGLQFNLNEDYHSNKGGSGREGLPADTEGSFGMGLTWRGDNDSRWRDYNARLTYREPAIDWDRERNTTDNNVSINKELPSLSLTLPRDWLGDGAYFNRFSLDLNNLVTGRRRSPESIFRAKASVGGSDRVTFSRASNLDTALDFDQYWYDDGNRQYSIRPRLTYSYDTFDWFKFDASWNMAFRQGVKEPPVANDRTTNTQNMNYGLTFTNRRSWRSQLRGGYDIKGDRFSPISVEFNWDPNRVSGLTATTTLTYAINSVTRLDNEGQSVSHKLKRFKLNPVRLSGYFRSPYIDPEGFYNWYMAWSLENDVEDGWQTTDIKTRYYKRYQRGWSSEIIGGYRKGLDPPIDFSEEFMKHYVKRISLRKTNCCTTFEGGWNADAHEVFFNVYLNALPQYPGMLDLYRYSTTSAEGTKYQYQPQLMFPVQSLMDQIMQDTFGFSNPFSGGVTNFGSYSGT